ncbi:MAG: rRNA maturation RNase YbeY [Thermodesulfobacteriota bacterium]
MGYPNAELSLLFTDDRRISELNCRYLKRDAPTNVLAFPMSKTSQAEPESSMLGDIVISLDAAERDAQVCGETLEGTVDRLLIHGLLHLLGYDHEKSEQEARRMDEETDRLLNLITSSGSAISEPNNG